MSERDSGFAMACMLAMLAVLLCVRCCGAAPLPSDWHERNPITEYRGVGFQFQYGNYLMEVWQVKEGRYWLQIMPYKNRALVEPDISLERLNWAVRTFPQPKRSCK